VKIQLLFFVVIFSLASCGNSSSEVEEQPATADEETTAAKKSPVELEFKKGITQQRPARETVDNTAGRESQLTTMTMDGSSEAAFVASLEKFQEAAPTSEYRKLKSAIQYLEVYDLSARGNKAKLYKNLNGLTAEEIIALTQR
jgi:hypothetical protein